VIVGTGVSAGGTGVQLKSSRIGIMTDKILWDGFISFIVPQLFTLLLV
jgi:hypothetical protein